MKTIREETVRGRTLRLVEIKDGYAGLVLAGKNSYGPFYGDDPGALWSKLEKEQARADPRYYGYDGAIRRLLHIFADGFAGAKYVKWERQYKTDAKTYLDETVPLDAAMTAERHHCLPALKAFQKTNLLSPYEKPRISEILKGPNGPDFLRAAASFTNGDVRRGLSTMQGLMRAHGQPSWPTATYLAFLWAPESHMFLKPEATTDFAARVGHRFADNYSSELTAPVYESLLDLAKETEAEIAELKPRDRIDTQSFIWIVGKYTDKDVAEVHAATI